MPSQTSDAPLPLAVTMGEPSGIGPEITAMAWDRLKSTNLFFALIGDAKITERFGPVERISSLRDAPLAFRSALPVLDLGLAIEVTPGRPAAATTDAVIGSIRTAVELALSGEAGGVVTNPIQKAILISSGFSFPGHTEFIGDLTAATPYKSADGSNRPRGPIMMIAGPSLRTVPVTVHQSLKKSIDELSSELIVSTGRVVVDCLKTEFNCSSPRLAIAGLNPHAGENGLMGREDNEIIAPAISALKAAGIDAKGPIPSDTMFHEDARNSYDAALCMYHDQALIPVKTIEFHEAVNVTLGLPIIRTSPDHGVALDIAWKGIAKPDSLIASIKLAASMSAARRNVN